MKQILVYFGLFSVFVAAGGSTKYLDSYSQRYADCAEKWQTSVKLAEGQRRLAERLLEIEAENTMTLGGDTCPALRPDHSVQVRSKLEAVIRG